MSSHFLADFPTTRVGDKTYVDVRTPDDLQDVLKRLFEKGKQDLSSAKDGLVEIYYQLDGGQKAAILVDPVNRNVWCDDLNSRPATLAIKLAIAKAYMQVPGLIAQKMNEPEVKAQSHRLFSMFRAKKPKDAQDKVLESGLDNKRPTPGSK